MREGPDEYDADPMDEEPELSDPFSRMENVYRGSQELQEIGETVARAIDGVAQSEFVEDGGRAKVATKVNGYVDTLEAKGSNEVVTAFEGQINIMDTATFEHLMDESIARVLAVSEALMRANDPAGFPEARLVTELNHHKEVIGLTLKQVKAGGLSKTDQLRAVLGAAVHDMAKYARRMDHPGAELRSFGTDKGDNFFSLFQHEILSARTAAELGNTSLFEDLSVKFPPEYFQMVAGTAAGHGRGEFPEEKARLGAFTNFGAEPDYYQLHLSDHDPASVTVHLSDVIQGEFGHNSDGWGGSFLKYFLAPPPKNIDEHLFKGASSSLNSTFKNYVEVLSSLNRAENLPDRLHSSLLVEAKEQLGAAYSFAAWVKGQSGDEIDTLNDKQADAGKRAAAYKSLLQKAKATGMFSPQNIDGAVKTVEGEFDIRLEQWAAELRGNLKDPSVAERAAAMTLQEAEARKDWEVAKYIFVTEKIAELQRLKQ